MDFKNSYRVEAVYFQKLKSDIDIAKSYIAAGATDEARAVLENLVDVDGAVLLLYRNIGECWAELANAIEKTKKELDALRDQQEQYHDELNEKIDEINNYIIRLINALDERLTAAEADIDDLQERMLAAESDIDDLEANKQDKLTAGFGIEINANNEISVDTDDVQEKLIAGQNITLTPDSTDPTKTVIDATGGANYSAGFGIDIDANNEISVDTNDVQEKLSAGFGIDIDANNEISVDTSDVQEKLIAGQNITLTPDSTDPTKTVIDAASYTPGTGIFINNNVISDSKPYDNTAQTGVDLIVENSFNLYEYVAPYYQVPSRKSIKKLVSLSDIENYLASYSDIVCVVSKPDPAANWTYPTNNFQSAINFFKVDFRYSLNNIDHYYDLATANGFLFAGVDIHGNMGLTTAATMTLTRVIQKLYETMKATSQQQIYFDIGILAKYVLNNVPQTNAMQNDDIGLLYNYRMKILGIK